MKFSIITPCFNMEKTIENTIKSIIDQAGNFEIEYIIVDSASTDNTLSIANKYKTTIEQNDKRNCQKIDIKIISEKDKGMYDALNKGFSLTTGDVLAWLNADDLYLPNAFETVNKIFEKYPDIQWLKGETKFADIDGNLAKENTNYIYNQKWITKGIYGRNAPFIHQDSVFWRKELWEKSGGLNDNLYLAGDYDLWIKFAKYQRLWSTNRAVSIFTKRVGQLSSNMAKYRNEQAQVSKEKGLENKIVKIFFWLHNTLPKTLANLFDRAYSLICKKEERQYIDFDENLTIKTSNSFQIHEKLHQK